MDQKPPENTPEKLPKDEKMLLNCSPGASSYSLHHSHGKIVTLASRTTSDGEPWSHSPHPERQFHTEYNNHKGHPIWDTYTVSVIKFL